MMRNVLQLTSLVLFLGLSSISWSQVTISSSLPVNTFLLFEGIPLRMEVSNFSGSDLVLSEEDEANGVVFRVRDMDNQIIPRTDRPILKEPWVIPDGETSVREFDLVQLFQIRHARSFRALQHVETNDQLYSGPPVLFDVSRGMLVDEIKRRKENRIFSLFGLNRGGRDVLLLRVTNEDKSMTLATYYLEKHMRFYPPHMKANKAGEVGTLHYVGPRQAVLCVFEPDGTPVKREYYQVNPGVPVRLHRHEENGFMVEGGTPVAAGE